MYQYCNLSFFFQVRREEYESFEDFMINPSTIYIDCHTMGWVAEPSFFQLLVPDLYKMGTDPGKLFVGWLNDDVSVFFSIQRVLINLWSKNVIDLIYSFETAYKLLDGVNNKKQGS